jgi:hypothetical protein
MMYRFIRAATAKTGAAAPAAFQFAAEVTSYLNKRYSLNMKFGHVMFGEPTIHWHFEVESLDKLRGLNEKLMQDSEYLGILEKFKDAWLEGSLKDTVIAFSE